MFDLHSIDLTNFRSYKGTHHFDFPTESGLYSLTGINKTNNRLGSNGSGKSTLLDAVFWCLYGRTTRGLKAGDVVSYNTKGCQVTVCLTVGHKRALVSRGQSPNTLQLNGEIIDQQALQGILRLSGEAFTSAVMLPQFGQSFFDLAPAAKLALFSQIMELEFWLERSEAAKLASAELEHKKAALEQDQARATAQAEGAVADIEELKKRSAAFSANQETIIKGLEQELHTLVGSSKNDDENLQSIKKAILGAEARLAKRTQELKLLDQRKQSISKELAVQRDRVERLSEACAQLTQLKSVCPMCRQEVDASHLKAEKIRLQNDLKEASVVKDNLSNAVEKLLTKLNTDDKDICIIECNKRDFEREQIRVASLIGTNERRCSRLKAEIGAEMDRPNPYESLLKVKDKALRTAREELGVLKAKIAGVGVDHTVDSYWINGFKKVRLFLIEETLRQLEIEVNNNLSSLGLTDWRIEFDVERENKSGGITKGFVVMVWPPGADEPIKYEAYSGGETQRLRLAGDLGLANLIMIRAGLTNTIEFYDEPSQHLSQEGLFDLTETLNDRALNSGKRIWLVDHHVTDYGHFAGSYTVVKTQHGSSIQAG